MKVLLKKTNIDRMLCLLINKYKKQQSEIMRRPDRQQLIQPELLGTSSVISQPKKPNAESLVQDIWEFDHDPNDSFLISVFNGKLRKYHSLEDCDDGKHPYPHQGGQPAHEQYHSLLNNHDKVGQSHHNIESDYGVKIMSPRIHKDISSKKSIVLAAQNQSELTMINQMQRVLAIDNNSASASRARIEQPTDQKDQTQSDAQSFIVPPPQKESTRGTNDPGSRQLDILMHKRISNLSYLARQTKEMLHLTRVQWLQLELEQYRKMLIKLEIECRRLKICLRSNSASSKLRSDIKIQTSRQETSAAVLQQYGYISPKINVLAHLKEKRHLSEKLIKPMHRVEQQTHANMLSLANRNTLREIGSAFIPSSQPNKLSQKKIMGKVSEEMKVDNKNNLKVWRQRVKAKDVGYRQLLLDKRQVIIETISKFQQHYEYKINKLSQENSILREQLKIVNQQIHENSALKVRVKDILSHHPAAKTVSKSINSDNEITVAMSPSRQITPEPTVSTLKKVDPSSTTSHQKAKRQPFASPTQVQKSKGKLVRQFAHQRAKREDQKSQAMDGFLGGAGGHALISQYGLI